MQIISEGKAEVKVKFAVMDNLKLEFPKGLFDIVTARHTIINANEYFATPNDLLKLLIKTPILDDFSEVRKCKNIYKKTLEKELFDKYIKNNTTSNGILLKKQYYGIVAKNNLILR